MISLLSLLPFLALGVVANEKPVWEVEFKTDHTVLSTRWISRVDGSICDILYHAQPAAHRMAYETNQLILSSVPLVHEVEPVDDGHIHDHDHDEATQDMLITAYAPKENTITSYLKSRCHVINYPKEEAKKEDPNAPGDVVREIVRSGDPSNRIDVVFMGDGYTATQQAQMENDMIRLTNDMFKDVTFGPYLPVFNIWSVFRASNQSGIGSGGRPLNTAFQLYRDGTELRGVYCNNPNAARDACRSTGNNACDFPSLIGNDPYYGGLGGEFTISTQSTTSGTLVLRHEMGHNFINVGEEYDGGSAYRGVNHSPSTRGTNVTWPQWLTATPAQLEGAQILVQEYPWYNLGNGDWAINFTASGTNGGYTRWLMRYSVSGCNTQNALAITLDGQTVPWTTRGSLDRFLEEVPSSTGLSQGTHRLVFRQVTPPTQGNPIRQLCSVTLHEYRAEPNFHMNNNYVSAYPTWRQGKVLAGYRPTNEGCLMRNMSSVRFCSVCYEGMWIRFFSMMSAIDSVTATCRANDIALNVVTVRLGQLREGGAQPGESLQVRWYYNNALQSSLNDNFTPTVSKSSSGNWRVEVRYVTTLVRSDPNNVLNSVRNFTVPTCT